VTRVLVVEDEDSFSDAISYLLRKEGFEVAVCSTGPDALDTFDRTGADLVLLDLMLPGLPGSEVCRSLREKSNVPVIMLTAKDSEIDKVVGLELGADDYVTKPFSPRELVLRVQAVLRRGGPGPGTSAASYGGGTLVIDEPRREVKVRNTLVELTPTEWGILVALATVPGRVYSRAELINRVRGYEFEGYERTVDSHVKNLRRKVEQDPGAPRIVQTVLGGGYRLGLGRDD
jgi:two-component system response regulator RegX3